MSFGDRNLERLTWCRVIAFVLLSIAPIIVAVASLAVLIVVIAGRDQLFRIEPLALDVPIGLAWEREKESIVRVYELLARGVGHNDPILYRHPITTGGLVREVGLLFVAAGESDEDLLLLLAEKGADLSIPINAVAVCATVLANRQTELQILLDDLGADPNPEPRCNDNRDSPLALARRLEDPRAVEILLANGALDDY